MHLSQQNTAGLSKYETQSISVYSKVSPAVPHHGSSLRNTWQRCNPPYVQDYWQARPVRQPARVLRRQLDEASARGDASQLLLSKRQKANVSHVTWRGALVQVPHPTRVTDGSPLEAACTAEVAASGSLGNYNLRSAMDAGELCRCLK